MNIGPTLTGRVDFGNGNSINIKCKAYTPLMAKIMEFAGILLPSDSVKVNLNGSQYVIDKSSIKLSGYENADKSFQENANKLLKQAKNSEMLAKPSEHPSTTTKNIHSAASPKSLPLNENEYHKKMPDTPLPVDSTDVPNLSSERKNSLHIKVLNYIEQNVIIDTDDDKVDKNIEEYEELKYDIDVILNHASDKEYIAALKTKWGGDNSLPYKDVRLACLDMIIKERTDF